MTENPITTTFELQRSAIEQSQQVASETIDAQRAAMETFVDGLTTFREFQQQGSKLTREAAHAQLDAIEQVNPDANLSELHTLVDESFEGMDELQEETWNAIMEATEEGLAAVDETTETYGKFVESTFDSYLQAHAQVEETASEFEEIDVSSD